MRIGDRKRTETQPRLNRNFVGGDGEERRRRSGSDTDEGQEARDKREGARDKGKAARDKGKAARGKGKAARDKGQGGDEEKNHETVTIWQN